MSRYLKGEQLLTPDRLEAIARHLGVSAAFLLQDNEVSATCDLLSLVGGDIDSSVRLTGQTSAAVDSFLVQFHTEPCPARALVVCAPIIGAAQVRDARRMASERGDVTHILLFSQGPPHDSADAEIHRAPPLPPVRLLSTAELASRLVPLYRLAEQSAAQKDTLSHRELEPRISFVRDSTVNMRGQRFLMSWLKAPEAPCHLLLIGDPGSGKTTQVRRFVAAVGANYLENPEQTPAPVYIQLWTLLDATDLYHRVLRELQDRLNLQNHVLLEAALRRGGVLIVLDGIDELVGPDPARLFMIERSLELLLRLPCRILLTARTPLLFGHDEAAGGSSGQRLPVRLATMLPLEREEVQEHLLQLPEGRRLQRLIDQHRLHELARHPYILDILCDGAPLYLEPFVGGRPVLYELLNRRYHQWLGDEATHFHRSPDDLRGLLGSLAAELRRLGRPFGNAADLPPSLANTLFPTGVDGALRALPRKSRFLHLGEDSFCFMHRLQEEFFFACWCAEQVREARGAVLRRLWLSRHDLTLLSGMLREVPIVQVLCTWLLASDNDPDLRELAAYLLAFTGDQKQARAALERIRTQTSSAGLRESAAFGVVVLGDEAELDRCIAEAFDATASRGRVARRVQLLSLGLHEQHLLPKIHERVLDALRRLDPEELFRELVALASAPEEPLTARAAAVTALGYLGDPRAQDLLKEIIDTFAGLGLVERPRHHLRLAMAARLALEELGMGRFPQKRREVG